MTAKNRDTSTLRLAGYSELVERYNLEPIPNWHKSFVATKTVHQIGSSRGIVRRSTRPNTGRTMRRKEPSRKSWTCPTDSSISSFASDCKTTAGFRHGNAKATSISYQTTRKPEWNVSFGQHTESSEIGERIDRSSSFLDSPVVLYPRSLKTQLRSPRFSSSYLLNGTEGNVRMEFEKVGSPGWTRTNNLRINSPPLDQLSYRGTETGLGSIAQLMGHVDWRCPTSSSQAVEQSAVGTDSDGQATGT